MVKPPLHPSLPLSVTAEKATVECVRTVIQEAEPRQLKNGHIARTFTLQPRDVVWAGNASERVTPSVRNRPDPVPPR